MLVVACCDPWFTLTSSSILVVPVRLMPLPLPNFGLMFQNLLFGGYVFCLLLCRFCYLIVFISSVNKEPASLWVLLARPLPWELLEADLFLLSVFPVYCPLYLYCYRFSGFIVVLCLCELLVMLLSKKLICSPLLP